jgi:putative DNA primase/helicase
MLNISTELDAVVIENSEDFKRLTSGEPVEAREIYGKPFEMRTSAKFLFLCNQLPRFKAGTDAELRRLRFLHFNQTPSVIDPKLKEEKIPAEKDGIFLLMVKYLKLLLTQGQVPEGSAESKILQSRFAQTNDPIGSFVQRYCVLDSTALVSKVILLKRFTAYVLDLGLPPAIANNFFKLLYDRYPDLKSTRPSRYPGQRRKTKKREYMIEGIGLIRP